MKIISKLMIILIFFAARGSVVAKEMNIVASTKIFIENGDWFPIPEKDMKAAAVDTALDELTKTGDFYISEKSNKGNIIEFNIALVGAAEIIRLTITLNVSNRGTLVSSVSQNISNLDRQGIYESFEYVGREAAIQLYEKLQINLHLANNLIPPLEDKEKKQPDIISNTREEISSNEEIKPYILKILEEIKQIKSHKIESVADPRALEEISGPQNNPAQTNNDSSASYLAIFNEAQRLKRSHKYRKARALFEEVISNNPQKDDEVLTLSKDELIYGIPMFQVSSMAVAPGNSTPEYFNKKFSTMNFILREMLANNNNSIKRTLLINQKLDEVTISSAVLKRVFETQALASVFTFKMDLRMLFETTMEWPSKTKMQMMLSRMPIGLELKTYDLEGSTLNLSLYSNKFMKKIRLTGDENGHIEVNLEMSSARPLD